MYFLVLEIALCLNPKALQIASKRKHNFSTKDFSLTSSALHSSLWGTFFVPTHSMLSAQLTKHNL